MKEENPWMVLSKELWKRLFDPFSQPPFVLYFLLAVLLGAMGVWVALAEAIIAGWQNGTQEPLFKSILTYFPAIGSLACVQVIITEDNQKSLRALFSLFLILFLSLALIAGITYPYDCALASCLVIIGTILAVLSWWLANSDRSAFSENPDPRVTIGGETDDEPAGDVEGFIT